MAAALSYQVEVATLLEMMKSSDDDVRVQATYDLKKELSTENYKLNEDLKPQVVEILLTLLDDNNFLVQHFAVSCLESLITQVSAFQVESIVATLCRNMVTDNEELNDVSIIGMEGVISELSLTPTGISDKVCNIVDDILTPIIPRVRSSVQFVLFFQIYWIFAAAKKLHCENLIWLRDEN